VGIFNFTNMFLKSFWRIIKAVFFICITFSCGDQVTHADTAEIDSTGWPSTFGFGRIASRKEIDSVNIDVSPDGEGLPPGSGTVNEGYLLYAQMCAVCHGKTGREGPYNKLVATSDADSPLRGDTTIGNYWPYATTLYDYVHRAMPYNSPGTLSPREVYSLTAFLLFKNDIIDSTIVIDSKNLPQVIMPARKLFFVDDRKGGPEIK
jgi:S-disulfanyl-L-cysteine oxidoreductase SoxD